MARLDLDFARSARLAPLTLLCLLLGAGGSVYELQQHEQWLARMELQDAESRRLERALSRAELRLAAGHDDDPKAQAETRRVAQALQQPWEAMLDAVQRAAGPELLITRLQPDATKGRLLISGQADSSAAFLGYLRRLRETGHWARVVPVSEEQGAPGARPLSFQALAEWKES